MQSRFVVNLVNEFGESTMLKHSMYQVNPAEVASCRALAGVNYFWQTL